MAFRIENNKLFLQQVDEGLSVLYFYNSKDGGATSTSVFRNASISLIRNAKRYTSCWRQFTFDSSNITVPFTTNGVSDLPEYLNKAVAAFSKDKWSLMLPDLLHGILASKFSFVTCAMPARVLKPLPQLPLTNTTVSPQNIKALPIQTKIPRHHKLQLLHHLKCHPTAA
ncbi:hypothetical protein BX661DRAFT_180090 [Kickxella alabastrina]|uniref:uncharacterized protein n=1 Tax=Kickxella alabastrina TaxID=61397 RepID=UPI00221FD816|nr:uncharacterized protein BX661DRAFT_180090 [Kickxella alabastrina]KAI7830791.1 hypothetical protein BX661DRAFT_180090 [Kickxella alabastrina]